MEPEMMITEARLRSALGNRAETPGAQPLVPKKRLAASTAVLVILSVSLLILAYMAVLITVARIVTAAPSG